MNSTEYDPGAGVASISSNQPNEPLYTVRLQQWRNLHSDPEKLPTAHRKVLIERVSQSMAFEDQPVAVERLKWLTNEGTSFVYPISTSVETESHCSNVEFERLAVPLVAIYDELLQSLPEQILINAEWICLRHKRLAGHLFPDWAGRFRDVNVQVGVHIPPPYYEVPIHMRQFCDDLAERLRHDPAVSIRTAAEFLAWTDWRFQWIHPFKDFNGRIGRLLLAALLYKLSLPHVETAPTDATARREYLEALNVADYGNLGPLTSIWTHRLSDTLELL